MKKVPRESPSVIRRHGRYSSSPSGSFKDVAAHVLPGIIGAAGLRPAQPTMSYGKNPRFRRSQPDEKVLQVSTSSGTALKRAMNMLKCRGTPYRDQSGILVDIKISNGKRDQ